MKTQSYVPSLDEIRENSASPYARVEAFKIKYLRLSPKPFCGWDYTRTKLGEISLERIASLEDCEAIVRRQFPEANQFTAFERRYDGAMVIVGSGTY